ncbi:MAG TPA: ribonuclease P protein component [Sphingobacterium sp.]|nr:ribonuclease P protein component [Sphingobacterium sp.]
MKQTFQKEERLCSKLLIDRLFHSGSSFIVYPFRIVFLPVDKKLPHGVQLLISVPKRKVRHAHKRNQIKRKIREAYRLQKAELLYTKIKAKPINLVMAIQYVATQDMPFEQYFDNMRKALNQVAHEVA